MKLAKIGQRTLRRHRARTGAVELSSTSKVVGGALIAAAAAAVLGMSLIEKKPKVFTIKFMPGEVEGALSTAIEFSGAKYRYHSTGSSIEATPGQLKEILSFMEDYVRDPELEASDIEKQSLRWARQDILRQYQEQKEQSERSAN